MKSPTNGQDENHRKREGLPLHEASAWVFDLDNTLYPASADLFGQMDPLMTGFIAETLRVSYAVADQIRQETWEQYGATLTGLMQRYDVDPAAFLEASHDLDLSGLTPAPRLARAIDGLPGRKVIHTNGPRAHAVRVLEARGLEEVFSEITAIEDTGHVPKPDPRSTLLHLEQTGISPDRAVMIEDQVKNLVEPARLGMATVWLTDNAIKVPDHVDHMTQDLIAFLEEVVG